MKTIGRLFLSLFKKGKNGFIKTLSLTISLTVGIVLFAKIYDERSYDNFYPDVNRIYQVYAQYEYKGEDEGKIMDDHQLPGGVIPGIRTEIPGVECATQFVYLGWGMSFKTEKQSKLNGTFILADTSFFDILPRPVLQGNAKEILGTTSECLVSERMAQKIHPDGDVVGISIFLDEYPGMPVTIKGIFEDLPRNSTIYYNVIISHATIEGTHMDGTSDWNEGSRYRGYVKLNKNISPESLETPFREMQIRHEHTTESYSTRYEFIPLRRIYAKRYEVQIYILVLIILAFIVAFSGILNYILIALSGFVKRSKEVAVYKCYGASGGHIYGIVVREAFLYCIISLLIAFFIILAFQGIIEELMELSIKELFPLKTVLFVIGVVTIPVFLLSAVLPAWIFVRIPVTNAFKGYRDSRQQWKKVLLFVQFSTTGFLIILLLLIDRQYNRLLNDDMGYNAENLLTCYSRGLTPVQRQHLIDQVIQLPFVKDVTGGEYLPLNGTGYGDNVWWPESPEAKVNVGCWGAAQANFLSVLEARIIEGVHFTKTSLRNDVLISRTLADRLMALKENLPGIVEQMIYIQGEGLCKVTGVFDDMRIGGIKKEEDRPTILFCKEEPGPDLLFRLYDMNPHYLIRLGELIEKSFSENALSLSVYKERIQSYYNSTDRLRRSLFWSGMFAFLISIMGLIGYVKDEVEQKTSEIAIRKINGGTVKDILHLFIKNILYIAIPALLMGTLGGVFLSIKWLESFSVKVSLPFSIWAVAFLLLLVVILLIAIFHCVRIALSNPAESLRSE